MNKRSGQLLNLTAVLIAGSATSIGLAQNGPPDHPTVTVHGKSWTPRAVLARNRGTPEDEDAQLAPGKIIGSLYYVGTRTLSTYLIVTPAGDIMIDSGYEHSVRPVIQKSVEQLGFKFSDIKIVLNNHEHGDHVEGDALVKELTGAQVIEIAEGEAGLRGVKPGGKEHPIDKIIHDGDTVTLGGTTLTAHLTAGHAHGGTTWTMKAQEGGKSYDVVIASSVRVGGGKMSPEVLAEYNRTFPLLRSLPCDVPLGDHTETFNIQEKFAKVHAGGPNPFIDPAGCNTETDVEDSMLHAVLLEQGQAAH
jgi:metallo-beta-lactamase class B